MPGAPPGPLTAEPSPWRAPVDVLAATILFNLGQGALRPSLPLYLRHHFGASYRMVTLIPVVFAGGKWAANLPTGYALGRWGPTPLMAAGLGVIGACDVLSVLAPSYRAFLAARMVAGAGWAMFATVATTTMVRPSGARGRAIGWLLMSETFGLLLGSAGGGWLYRAAGPGTPFVFEAACMTTAAAVVCGGGGRTPPRTDAAGGIDDKRRALAAVVHAPGIVAVSAASAALAAIQTGVLVFLLPLYLAEQGRMRVDAVGSVIALSIAARLPAVWIGGRLSDRRERTTILAAGLFGFAVVLGLLPFIRQPVPLALCAVAVGAAGGFVAGLPAAIVADRVDPSQHGIAIGWLRTVTDVGMLLGPLVMGSLADAVDLAAPFVCAAVLAGTCGLLCARHAPRVRAGSAG